MTRNLSIFERRISNIGTGHDYIKVVTQAVNGEPGGEQITLRSGDDYYAELRAAIHSGEYLQTWLERHVFVRDEKIIGVSPKFSSRPTYGRAK